MNTIEEVNKINDRLIEIREHFHKNPELSFQEIKTSQKIADILRELGLDEVRNARCSSVCNKSNICAGAQPFNDLLGCPSFTRLITTDQLRRGNLKVGVYFSYIAGIFSSDNS